MAYKDFTTENFHFRSLTSTTATTLTITLADEAINFTGSSATTFTLPVISTMVGTTNHKKAYKIINAGTAVITLTPGTGNTIDGKSVLEVIPNTSVVIQAQEVDTDWEVASPYPVPAAKVHSVVRVVPITATTATNVYDSAGAPTNLNIVDVYCVATSTATAAGTVTVVNGTDTVCTIAKATNVGLIVGASSISNAFVAEGSIFTVTNTTANTRVVITAEEQSYA